jgi:hypothetical protein
VEPFEGERGSGAVAYQALDARTVLAVDAHGGVHAEPTGALPREHVVGVGLIEEAGATKPAEDAALEDGFEGPHVGCAQLGGLVEVDVTVGGSREHAVEDDEVVVGVGV